jgi:hypothetical protein
MSNAGAKDKTQSFDTRMAHATLLDSLEAIRKSLATATTERKVEIGSVLWQLGDRVRDVLDDIKKDVRVVAVAELKGQVGHTTLEGDDLGEAIVNIPEVSLRVPKGTNIDDLKKVLGSDFGLFFEETITIRPRKEFEDRVTVLTNPLHQQILHNAVARVEPTPRVSFKRHKLSKREEG